MELLSCSQHSVRVGLTLPQAAELAAQPAAPASQQEEPSRVHYALQGDTLAERRRRRKTLQLDQVSMQCTTSKTCLRSWKGQA